MILKGYILGIGYAMICLLLSFILYKLGLPKKYTRKVVHILVGFEWVILYHFMGAGLHFLAVCILFLILLTVAYKGRFMPMIASDADNAPGTVYYAVAMTGVAAVGCFLPDVMIPFGIGVMCTSVGDGFAGIAGQLATKRNRRIYGKKTLVGAFTNLLVSTFSALIISMVYSLELGLVYSLLIGCLAVGLELVTPRGLDNISITWGITAFSYALIHFGAINDYILPILLTPVIIMLAKGKRALTSDGILAAILLDIAVSVAFGNRGFVILCCFFLGSIAVDKIKKRYKKQGRVNTEAKGDCRDYMQVVANGAVAFVSALLYIVSDNSLFAVPFVASMAEAFSDTVASGVGAFAKTTYDPFRRRKCEKGLSGGMSVVGTVSSFVAAALIALVALSIGFVGFGIFEALIVLLCAFVGAFIDSALGSLVQVKYRCGICGRILEKKVHCTVRTDHYSGFAFIDNDAVNLIACISSSALALLVAFIA